MTEEEAEQEEKEIKKDEGEISEGKEEIDEEEEKVKESPSSETEEKVKEEREGQEKKVKGEEVKEEGETTFPDTDELSAPRLLTTGLRVLLISILLTSVLYVLATTGIGNLAWRGPARGNLVKLNSEAIGSKLIGQSFSSEKYFHPRPSSKDYDAMDSGSANLSPENEKLARRADEVLERLTEDGIKPEDVPVSFVTESGSALDPHIVPESAYLQVPRVSEATGIDSEKLKELIREFTRGKFIGLYGQKRVNVLTLNMEIEKILESG